MSGLVVQNLVKEYPTPREPLRILDGVSFSLSVGESLAVLGPSGSGKSTLLAILGSLEPPSSGNIQLGDQDPFSLNEQDLANFRSRHIGFIFQEHHLLPQCTVLENVLVPFLADRLAKPESVLFAKTMLDRVGLADRLDHRPAELSGGERQRVAIVRALVRKPSLILADEPTGNLDRTTASGISELLAELITEQNAMLVVVTHSNTLANVAQQRMELVVGKLIDL